MNRSSVRHSSSDPVEAPPLVRAAFLVAFFAAFGLFCWHTFGSFFSSESYAQESPEKTARGGVSGDVPKGDTPIPQEAAPKRGRIVELLGADQDAGVQSVRPAARVGPEVRRLLRRLVSGDEAESQVAEKRLRKLGVTVIPELRAWLRTVRVESVRVETVLRSIVTDLVTHELPPTAVSRDFSAAEYFQRKFRQAEEHLRYGRYDRARRIAESIIELDESSPLRFLCRRLVRRATEKKVREKLEPRVDVGSLVYEIGEKPKVMFRLQNRSDSTARFEVEEGVVGELTVTVERRFFGGNKKDRERRALRLKQERTSVKLAPGQGWEYQIPYELPKDLPLKNAVVRIQFQAVFRPTIWEIDGDPDGNIPVRTTLSEFWVIPPGKKRKLEDPLRRLTLALTFRRPEDLLVSGWLCAWGGEKDSELNDKLVDEIVKALPELPTRYQVVAYDLLRHASGRSYKTLEGWRRWWKTERSAP